MLDQKDWPNQACNVSEDIIMQLTCRDTRLDMHD